MSFVAREMDDSSLAASTVHAFSSKESIGEKENA